MSDSPNPPVPGAELPAPSLAEEEEEQHIERWLDDYGPVPVRYRHDGWVPDRQVEFIEALADCGCVEEAARAVGMSRNSAYALRRRPDAQAFRLAWDAAMDNAVARLRDAAMARAIHGVAVPVFHKGELVGEQRHFDERLTMFLLRYRDPEHHGKWLDRNEWRRHPDGPTSMLAYRVGRLVRAAWRLFDAALAGKVPPKPEQEVVPREGNIEFESSRAWH
jgi:hypothetical protein